MKIDTKRAKLSTISQEIKETLKQGQSVVFLGRATVTEARFKDNQDGSVNATYIVKPELIDFRASDTQESLVDTNVVKKKSRSQATKQLAFKASQLTGRSENGLYNSAMDDADNHLQNVIDER